jgi:hypothetical protein
MDSTQNVTSHYIYTPDYKGGPQPRSPFPRLGRGTYLQMPAGKGDAEAAPRDPGSAIVAWSAGGNKGIRALRAGHPEERRLWVLLDCVYASDDTIKLWRPWFDAAISGRTRVLCATFTFNPGAYFGIDEVVSHLVADHVKGMPDPGRPSAPYTIGGLTVVRWHSSDVNDTHAMIWRAGVEQFDGNSGTVAPAVTTLGQQVRGGVLASPLPMPRSRGVGSPQVRPPQVLAYQHPMHLRPRGVR